MDHLPGQRVIAAFNYRYPLDGLIKQIKYKQRIRLVSPLVKILSDRIQAVSFTLPEVMVPVPLHPHRLYTRGFNQSRQICSVLSWSLPLCTDTDLVIRTRNTLPMFNLEAEQRRENIEGAFQLVQHCRYKSIAIVDDIITSCSTMNELARLFHKAGVEQIQYWALARAD